MKNEPTKAFNLAELRRLSNGDEKFISEMISVFIKTTEDGIMKIENGLRNKDYKTIEDCAHKIAPPCRYIGVTNLFDTLKKIENHARHPELIGKLKALITKAKFELNNIIIDIKNR